MTTDTDFDRPSADDEIALPRFEGRLQARLAEAHRQHLASPAPVRRVWLSGQVARRSLQAGIIATAAAALVVAAVIVRQPDPAPDAPDTAAADPTVDPTTTIAPTTTGPVEADLATRISEASQQAGATMIVHTFQDNATHGDNNDYFDVTSGTTRFSSTDSDGAPSLDSIWRGAELTSIDHCFSEYSVTTTTAPESTNTGITYVGKYVADGWLVEAGTEVVDGRQMIRLEDPDAPADHTLVDAATYLPYKAFNYQGTDTAYVQTYEYLPRTPENLALLEPAPPAGFTQVEQLRGDGARFDAGCGY